MQSLFSVAQSAEAPAAVNEKTLVSNIIKTSELYLFLLELPFALQEYLSSEKENEKAKYYPDKAKIRQFSALDDNALIIELNNNARQFKRRNFLEEWNHHGQSLEELFNELKEQEFFIDYLVFDHHDFEQCLDFLRNLFDFFINGCEKFYNLMEELYPVWLDDEETIYKEIQRGFDKTRVDHVKVYSPENETHEDVRFAVDLFRKVKDNSEFFEEEIQSITTNWDPNRIALIDLITIKMAMAEYLYFQDIPLKVTINEYIEIIKAYSTPNSSKFVNGVIDKLKVNYLASNKIQKSEKGLRG